MRKVFVQNRQSKLLFCDRGKWTSTRADARNFKTTLDAMAFCLQQDLRDTHILVDFGDAESEDVIVPVDDIPPRVRPPENSVRE